MGFVGVTTGQSSIMRVFPEWARVLGLPTTELTGFDLPLTASRADYRAVITRIADDPAMTGALITTHKIGVYQAAADLFDGLDDFAARCGEISSVSKKDGKLTGHAKDPLTAGLAIEEFLAPGHFAATGGDLLCLGAGGSGTALTWYLTHRPDSPNRIICTDTNPARLAALKSLLPAAQTHVVTGPADSLVESMSPGSLIVNATGLGKDQPGSPVTPRVRFPSGAVAWEINYRGSLEFLQIARSSGVTAVDGWRYFVHGWAQVIAEVFGLSLDDAVVEELSEVALRLR